MSASQLLRILHTLPMAADDEICAFNTGEQEASMNRSSRCTNPFLQSDENINDVNFWDNPQLASSIFGNEFSNNHEDETDKKSTAVCNIVPSDLFEKTTGFYINKHSVECELPELIVCYQESDYQVKNICIDDDIADEKAISILKNNQEFLCNSVPLNEDDDDFMNEASCDTEFLENDWLRPSTITGGGCYMDVELNSSAKNATNNYLTDTCEAHLNLSKIIQDDVNQHPLQGSEEELFKRDSVVSEAENLSRNGQMAVILDESKMGGNAAFHFNNRKSATSSDYSSGAMHPESIYELPLEIENTLSHQDVGSASKLDMANHEMRYVGDSSFSMAGVISELISCSRPMPFAAGISSRSNSSATSTRSFAFPTLETEYVSSPVRMGKTDRRRLQKQRGWRKGLLCCKF